MLTLAMMLFFYTAVPTFGVLTLVWNRSDWLNILIRCWFALMTVIGLYVIFTVLRP